MSVPNVIKCLEFGYPFIDWKITPALSLYNGSANSPYNIRIGDVKSANLSSLYQLAVGPQLMNR